MNDSAHAALSDDIKLLGRLLGEALVECEGQELYDAVEELRRLAIDLRRRGRGEFAPMGTELRTFLSRLSPEAQRGVARAFATFLNLANIAEQHHRVRRRRYYERQNGRPQRGSFAQSLAQAKAEGNDPAEILRAINELQVELVLTAHPTEITRRSVQQKFHALGELLSQRDRDDLTPFERQRIDAGLTQQIQALWLTDEIRRASPTPLDEAASGLLIFEQTLWNSVPALLRKLDRDLRQLCGQGLPLDRSPLRFGSWMGGDRDGNPFVTSQLTRRACWMNRAAGLALFEPALNDLAAQLSLSRASDELHAKILPANADARSAEPYRALLTPVRERLRAERDWLDRALSAAEEEEANGGTKEATKVKAKVESKAERKAEAPPSWMSSAELGEALLLCHRSLIQSGAGEVARGELEDLLRRLQSFGLNLVRLDLRQHSALHREAMDLLSATAGETTPYQKLSEDQRVEFFARQLPHATEYLAPAQREALVRDNEVLRTFAVAGELPAECLGAYVISMCTSASDVLTVEFLQRVFAPPRAAAEIGAEISAEIGGDAGPRPLRAVPLFETLEDLVRAPEVMAQLLDLKDYRALCRDEVEVMVGYSDSAKDAGRLASSWTLYETQEKLAQLCRERKVELTLFHGRGGSVGRGGGPLYLALLSQPPGTITRRVRFTEQGEMIQAKFGLGEIAERTLELYLTGTLQSMLRGTGSRLGRARPEWTAAMQELTRDSVDAFRREVRDNAEFLDFFHHATPVVELAELHIGSRPAKRKASGGLDSLRAIPWIFSWTQNRLLLPSWFGVGEALAQHQARHGSLDALREMHAKWPYFRSLMELVEMVLAKADPGVTELYFAELLDSDAQKKRAQFFLASFDRTVELVKAVVQSQDLLHGNPVLQRSILLRNPYVDPINLLQVEALRENRARGEKSAEQNSSRELLLLTFNGIAAGMRNTG